MTQDVNAYHRYCPDQPKILISDAVCRGRRRVNYPYCAGCPFNDDEQAARSSPGASANATLKSGQRPGGRSHS
ncbi:MAG TPA: hypothetical protein PKK06_13385 [Phycisphaerae bacterium]|nr:hypothetical protein [Phycisphaerae bacterium]HNU45727.1 hypothetical protein [Phycisphaerae bacterium]